LPERPVAVALGVFGVFFCGSIPAKVFTGADLAAAFEAVKMAFPPKPGSQWVSDQPLEKD